MRNPSWHRDEIILALDLYFSKGRGTIDKSNPKIVELSTILNMLPIFSNRPDSEKFRNPNGVALKLSNFLSVDPDYKGKGMVRASKLDGIVFKEFQNDKERLRRIASEIRIAAKDRELRLDIYKIEEDEQTLTDSVTEGQVLYKLHKVRERSPEIVDRKKKQVLKKTGKLDCEVCSFNFEKFYGEYGRGYIECHHRTPLFLFSATTRTKLDDLALVCSNCHRILHRRMENTSIDQLRSWVKRY